MTSFGNENYVNYRYAEYQPRWMKAERLDYCDQTINEKPKKHHILVQMLLSIFF